MLLHDVTRGREEDCGERHPMTFCKSKRQCTANVDVSFRTSQRGRDGKNDDDDGAHRGILFDVSGTHGAMLINCFVTCENGCEDW